MSKTSKRYNLYYVKVKYHLNNGDPQNKHVSEFQIFDNKKNAEEYIEDEQKYYLSLSKEFDIYDVKKGYFNFKIGCIECFMENRKLKVFNSII